MTQKKKEKSQKLAKTMIFPLRKTHRVPLVVGGDTLYIFDIPQASASEQFDRESREQKTGDFVEEMMEMYGQYIYPKKKLWSKIIDPFYKKKHKFYTIQHIAKNVREISQSLVQARFTPYESIYTGIQKRREKGEKSRKGYIGTMLMSICSSWNVDLKTLLDNYTMEQIMWMYDAVIFQSYEMTDSGQNANDRAMDTGKDMKEFRDANNIDFLESLLYGK